METEAEISVTGVRTRLVHYRFRGPLEHSLRIDGRFRIEFGLTSRHRSARACFRDLWTPNRFEPIGDLFLVPPGFDVLARSEGDSLTSIVFEFNADYVYELFDRRPSLMDRYLVAALNIKVPRIRNLLVQAAEEAKKPGFASPLLVELLARQLAVELVRHGNAVEEHRTQGGLVSWQLRVIDERLEEVREAPKLSELAGLCRVSVRQLARAFRASRGCSIGAYVADCQMEHAKRLLASDQSVAFIANALGFSSSSYFCSAFRHAMGLTPGQFRDTLLRH